MVLLLGDIFSIIKKVKNKEGFKNENISNI